MDYKAELAKLEEAKRRNIELRKENLSPTDFNKRIEQVYRELGLRPFRDGSRVVRQS